MSGCTFFLPFTAGDGDKDKGQDKGQNKDKSQSQMPLLVVGQPVECLVQEVNMTARSATLRMHRTAVVKAIVNSTILPFNALTPGQHEYQQPSTNTSSITTVLTLALSIS